MASSGSTGPVSQQYAASATVPLIKSPSLWLPKPIELPNDIHPLPEDITAYFVYPFSLESHVLSIHPSPHEAISERIQRNETILKQRLAEEEQRERAALHKMAPGYNPTGLLVPLSASTPLPPPTIPTQTSSTTSAAPPPPPPATKINSMMDDLESLSFSEEVDQGETRERSGESG